MFEVYLPQFLGHYDQYFAEKKTDFLFGDKPVTADFLIGGIYVNYITNPNVGYGKEQYAAAIANYPNYKAYGDRYAALLGSYLTSRPPAPI